MSRLTRLCAVLPPLAPVAAAASVPLGIWAGDPLRLTPLLFLPPLVVLLTGWLILSAIAARLAPDRGRAALLLVGFVLAWRWEEPARTATLLGGVLMLAIAWVWTIVAARRGRRLDGERVGRIASLIAAIMLGGSLLGLASGPLPERFAGSFVPPHAEPPARALAERPSVWLILADGHGRADDLARIGYDSSSFLASLARLDFTVAADGRSNYSTTEFSLPSFLNGGHIETIYRAHPSWVTADGSLDPRRAIERSRGLAALRGLGYRIDYVSSGWEALTPQAGVELRDPGPIDDAGILFGLYAGPLGLLNSIPGAPEALLATRIRNTLAEAGRLADRSPDPAAPAAVIVHLPSPHMPPIFNADGSLRSGTTLTHNTGLNEPVMGRLGLPAYRAAVAAQTEWVDGQLLALVERIIARDPEARILLFGDHGLDGLLLDADEATSGRPTLYGSSDRVLLAVRSPDGPPAAGSLVNALGRFLSPLGVEWPTISDERFYGCEHTIGSCVPAEIVRR